MADEKLNTGPAENISPEAAEPITTPEQAAASEPSRNRPGLPYLSPAMWLCPLTKSMNLWRKRGRTPAPKSKSRKPPKRQRRQPPEKHRSPPIRRNRKSRAVAVRRKRKRLRLKIKNRRNRLGLARAAHPRRIRRPLTSPSRPNETKCPEAMERPRMPRSPLFYQERRNAHAQYRDRCVQRKKHRVRNEARGRDRVRSV